MKRLPHVAAMIVVSCALAAGAAFAQSYPNKAVRIVVPQLPGGGNDAIARMIGQKLTVSLKQQVVVDNRPGAGGLIAAELVAKSQPDGYTLLLANVATMAIIPNVQKKVPYDPLRDFEPVSLVATAPLLVVVHPSLPVHSIKQLIALAKARPAQLNYASNGVGSSTHLATEMFVMMAGIRMVHVPYKGLSAATSDLLSGQVQVMFSSAVAMMPQVKAADGRRGGPARLRSGIVVRNRRACRHSRPHRRSAEPGHCRGDEVTGRHRAVDFRGGDCGGQLAARVFRLYQERVRSHRQGGQGVRFEVRIEAGGAMRKT